MKILIFICSIVLMGTILKAQQLPSSIKEKFVVTSAQRERVMSITPNLVDITSFLPKNYVTDGSVDYTDFLQKGINGAVNVLMPNFPILINDKGLILKSNSIIIFNRQSKLILKPSSNEHYQMLRIYNLRNVKVYFANLIGDKLKHLGKKGEFGMGISIRGARSVEISFATIKNCWGDGIYLDDYSQDISLNNCTVDNNRRNGVSIVFAKNITINNILASNTNGTSPMAGIDIEPDNNSHVVDNIVINNPVTFNNKNRGILVALTNLPGPSKRSVNITINNHIDIGSNVGMAFYPGKNKYWNNLDGTISVDNPDWILSSNPSLFLPTGALSNNIKVKLNLNNNMRIQMKKYTRQLNQTQNILLN